MLALLPDVGLQRALLRVLQGQGAPKLPQELLPPNLGGRGAREPVSKPPSWAKSVLSLVQCCRACGQVRSVSHHILTDLVFLDYICLHGS